MTDTTDIDAAAEGEAGLDAYHEERYGEAAEHFRRAVDADPSNGRWQHLLAASTANAVARIDEYVPEVRNFEEGELLAPPPDPRLPTPPHDKLELSPSSWFRYHVGHLVGAVGGGIFGFLTSTFGRRYRGDVWTNWYRKRTIHGILTLGYMREKLNRENLMSTYPEGSLTGYASGDLAPPEGVEHFRTADGSWSNLADPKEGAAGTRFPRNVDAAVIRPATDEELMDPNPRTVSREFLTRGDEMREVPFLNLLAASWIQFQNHDWISHGDNLTTKLAEIPLDEDDPARIAFGQRNMFVPRTQPDPTRKDKGEPAPTTFVNEVTHWWDGSQIYGSDQATQDRLRLRRHGHLRLTDEGTLPLRDDDVEDSGMIRNWWVGLAMLHTLFAREHNSICDHLAEHHPDWDDDRLFNVARLVNAAVMAKIHSIEWTPAILPNPSLDLGLNSNWYGMLTYRFRKGADRKTVARYNVANPEMGGLVGNKTNKHGRPFGLTEEFVEVYRLHSLLPETLKFRRLGEDEIFREVPFAASRQAGSPVVTDEVGMTDLFYSFGREHPGQLVLNNFPRFMQELSVPGNPVFDMGAVDLLRARERGVPRYNDFREQLGLKRIESFDQLTEDEERAERLHDVYGGNVDKLDLLIGTLAEEERPTGFGFGETLFQIFILNASRRLQADRFYTESYNEEVYTKEGMAWVDDATLKTVLLRHHPELRNTGLANVKNAFEPWDTGELEPARHPLREWDPELKSDPWSGDAA